MATRIMGAKYPIEATTAEGLLTRVQSFSPESFERLVVDLVARMDYGGLDHESAQVVGRRGDEGIDGVIIRDPLGLDVIYLQAKRWKGTVGRPVVQQFVGALHGRHARKGVLVTTGRFSRGALEYVTKIEPQVVLVDGSRLVELLLKYGLGVTTVESDDDTVDEVLARPSPPPSEPTMEEIGEPFRTLTAMALFALPTLAREGAVSRTLGVGADQWLEVVYEPGGDSPVPFGLDLLMWLWAVHEAITKGTPAIYFNQLLEPLSFFGRRIDEGGRTTQRARESWDRIAACRVAASSHQGPKWPQPVKLLERCSLPQKSKQCEPLINGEAPSGRYGVLLSEEVWAWIQGAMWAESPLDGIVTVDRSLVTFFRRRPIDLRYGLFLFAWAHLHPQKGSAVSVEELARLLCSPSYPTRHAKARFEAAHSDLNAYLTRSHGRQLRAEWTKRPVWDKLVVAPRRRGPRPARWVLRFPPGRQLLSAPAGRSQRQ